MCFFLLNHGNPFLAKIKQLTIKKTLQHTSSIPFTYNWIGSFLFLFIRSAQGACETRAFSFVSRCKHLLEREGLLKISTSSRISIPVTCAQCSQRFCERRCLLYPSRQLVSLAVPLLIGRGFTLATDAECFTHALHFQSRLRSLINLCIQYSLFVGVSIPNYYTHTMQETRNNKQNG